MLLPGIGYETLTYSSSFTYRIMDNLPRYVIMQLAQEKAILLKKKEDGVRNKRLSSPLLSPTIPNRVD